MILFVVLFLWIQSLGDHRVALNGLRLCPLCAASHPQNAIVIPEWKGDDDDTMLLDLLPMLMRLCPCLLSLTEHSLLMMVTMTRSRPDLWRAPVPFSPPPPIHSFVLTLIPHATRAEIWRFEDVRPVVQRIQQVGDPLEFWELWTKSSSSSSSSSTAAPAAQQPPRKRT